MLQLVNIHTYYGDSHVLRGVSLEVGEASVAVLLGRNGMGKTTTINSIIGFNPPRQGSVLFKSINIVGLQPYQTARMGISLVPQGRRIWPSLTVKENLTIGARIAASKAGIWIEFFLPPLGSRKGLVPEETALVEEKCKC